MVDCDFNLWRLLHQAARNQGLSWHDAEDVVQKVLLEHIDGIPTSIHNHPAFLKSAVKKRAIDQIRTLRRRREVTFDAKCDPIDRRKDFNDCRIESDFSHLHRAISRLSPARKSYVHAKLNGVTDSEYAAIECITRNTVEGRKREAVNALRRDLSA